MANLRVGKPDTSPDAPSHVEGVRQGNEPGGIEQDPGFYKTGGRGAGRGGAKSTARRSTGINPEARNPIDPSSPTLTPA
ncbi:MAG: hypothetical protein ACRDSJ_06190 [Rubrobacteraceae bacterium]